MSEWKTIDTLPEDKPGKWWVFRKGKVETTVVLSSWWNSPEIRDAHELSGITHWMEYHTPRPPKEKQHD